MHAADAGEGRGEPFADVPSFARGSNSVTKQFLNTLYVGTEGAHARLENDQVRVEREGEKLIQVPLHHLGTIVLFGTCTASSSLMMRCADDGRSFVLLDRGGRFRARIQGKTSGNVLLRKAHYDRQADPAFRLQISKEFVAGKLQNARQVLLRGARDLDAARKSDSAAAVRDAAEDHAVAILSLPECETEDEVRGTEGMAAQSYFGVIDSMITSQRTDFRFDGRSRRPPLDRTNCIMSFLYSLATSDCVSALEGVGLDPQFGFLHVLRPGRPALALDLLEEFRSIFLDRLALSMINRKQIQASDFELREGGAVLLNEDGRKKVLSEFQRRKQVEVRHRLFEEPVPVGLLAHVQARLLARVIRGDVAHYQPYLPA
jgi:CRISPR-associated protein Cas1